MRQTDFSNDEAVGYLADRLRRLGVEDGCVEPGAEAGDEVVIGDDDNAVVFDWEPTLAAGAELLGRPARQRPAARGAHAAHPRREAPTPAGTVCRPGADPAELEAERRAEQSRRGRRARSARAAARDGA